MLQQSLYFRLMLAAIGSISVAIVVFAFSLLLLFEYHVERRINLELESYLNQIITSINITKTQSITFTRSLSDTRFEQHFSGLYWLIHDEDSQVLLGSRSLWDQTIDLPDDELSLGVIHRHELPGPAQQQLLVRERQVLMPFAGIDHRLRVAVAIDKQFLIEARNAFSSDLLPYLIILALLLFIAAALQIRFGLTPLNLIRNEISDIRNHKKQRLKGRYPREVMPLVDEINDLISTQEKNINNARTWTADLAHGLKTPLMTLSADAQRLRQQGNTDMADDLEQLTERMSRRVDRELIRARVRSSKNSHHTHTDCKTVIESVVRALKRTEKGSSLEWRIVAQDNINATVSTEDLTELVGNVAENACKWANRQVEIRLIKADAIAIEICDDGPGVDEYQLTLLGQRGMRLDEQHQGYGLGLAIARDIVEACDGEISFKRSKMGGLLVMIRISK